MHNRLAHEANFSDTLSNFFRTIADPWAFYAMCPFFFFVGLAIATPFLAREDRHHRLRMMAQFQILSSAITFIAVISETGAWLGAFGVRYFYVPFCSGFVLLAALTLHGFAQLRQDWLRTIVKICGSTAVMFLLGIVAFWAVPTIRRGTFVSEYRQVAKCVARVAKKKRVNTVLAEYSYSKALKLFSSNRLASIQVDGHLNPRLWITPTNWAIPQRRVSLVLTANIVGDVLNQRAGAPESVVQCGGVALNVYGKQQSRQLYRLMRRLVAVTKKQLRPSG